MIRSHHFSTFRNAAFASAFLFASLALAAGDSTTITLGLKDSRRSTGVKVGGTVLVRLPAQLGTGHRWFLAPTADPILVQDGEPRIEPIESGDKTKRMPGAAEYQVFRFTAKAAGKTDLKFQYYRDFEPGKQALRSATFHIRIVAPKK
jgi:predicted secreted protein